MADKIGKIRGVAYSSSRVEPVRNYSPQERAEKLSEIDRAAADRAEIREILARYPNPDHLSFPELLEKAINENKVTDDDLDYILDIGHQKREESGYTLKIGEQNGK